MNKVNKLPDPDELLFTLDQLEQTTEVMAKVVNRLKHQLQQLQAAPQASSQATPGNPDNTNSKHQPKARRTLH
ncbi:hypothetical protein [Gilvimarinus xylanilyticus]|uniref:Uncharacterized protein n=1 Tax=Gilvimarinus xylanilyticus TaxID=2944139 RepID=A0A9X2KWM6_9GAMM|nr:hypothetical protein [Gilvimarinus xylanilyticus]MCP8899130.1 hypothetical protein [Gilvimarinus xylanilyticus]